MPIEPIKIPQNVYIEDRIIGPLTLRQIIISMLGMGFSYAIWASIAKVMGAVPLHITVIVWIPGALALVLAFVRINDLSMMHLLFLLVERLSKPQQRVFGPRRGLAMNVGSFVPTQHITKKVSARQHADGEIGTLSAFLDSNEVDESDTAQEPTQTDDEQGASIPAQPVNKDRIRVSPMTTESETQTPRSSLFHDIVHPPSSHV